MSVTVILTALTLGAGVGEPVSSAGDPPNQSDTTAGTITAQYRRAAARIIDSTLAGNDGYNKLEELCVGIGHRLSGSPQLDRAVKWAVAAMAADGQENVHPQPVMVPHWVRGREGVLMLEPRVESLPVLGLGGSVGTTADGITAEVVVVEDEAGLETLGEGARGKIVLFNNPMPEYDPEKGSGYGTAVRFRINGPRLAAEYGAVACLIRSVTANSLRTPHTGVTDYGDAKVKIPAAALTIEDTETIARLFKRGIRVVVNLQMGARTLPDTPSANVVGELRGSTRPEEVVVIGGHLDSWDAGHGAHDDAGGCVIAMEAINVLRRLNMIPKRTIRVVLWTNEENGVRGGKGYAEAHADELSNHVAAIEADMGVFKPTGFSLQCINETRQAVALEQMTQIAGLLEPLGATNMRIGGSGVDIDPMKPAGVVLMGMRVDGSKYFDYHHSPADTIDKVDPEHLSQNIAALATVAYVIADMPQRFGESSTD
ncbi:MAG: M20/M25/M40 family metallo-hydrolase [Phycisphaerales bacterium]|nr:MAG: M20/M25/M40 family metallo-hydrolase [Phycisphaerales bacterium]